jgi:hypothetical protein
MLISNSKQNYQILSDKLVYLNGMSMQHQHILKQNKEQWLNYHHGENKFVHGARLVFSDLKTGDVKSLDGNYLIEEDSLFDSLGDIISAFNTYSLIQAFEAFKRFVKYDLLFKLLENEEVFLSLGLYSKVGEVTVAYAFEREQIFTALTYKYRSLNKLLDLYKHFDIEVKSIENERGQFRLQDLFFLLEEIRHSVVHGTNITYNDNQKVIKQLKSFNFLDGVLTEDYNGYKVKISADVGEMFYRIFASTAHYIYTY